MHVPDHPTLIRRMLGRRLKQVTLQGPLLAASLAEVHKRCGQPSYACHRGGSLHRAHHLTYKDQGKTRTVYVPQALLDEVQTWVAEHQRLKKLLSEISQLTLALVHNHTRDRKRRRGRP